VLKTAGKQGEIKKRITVTSNDPEKANLFLEIKGEIVVDVLVEPRNVGFRQLSKGVEATALLTVKVAEPDKIKVAELGVDDPRFEIKMTSGELATESKWEVKFKGTKELGSLQAKITVKYTAAGEPKTLEVPIRASVVGDLQYVRSIHFGKSPTTGFSAREVRLSSRSGKTVKIKKVEDPDGLLKIDVATPEGNPAVFKATVVAPDGDYSKPTQHVLKVRTNDPDEPVVEISYMISLRNEGRRALPKEFSGASPSPRFDAAVPRKAGAPNVPPAAGSTADQKPEDRP
jgi:hypothetical protein